MDRPTDPPADEIDDILLMDSLKARFAGKSTATDIRIRVPSGGPGIGNGLLLVPGWIRERAAEVLFNNDEIGESGRIAHCRTAVPAQGELGQMRRRLPELTILLSFRSIFAMS